MIKIVLIDNYDNFTYKHEHLLEQINDVEVDFYYNGKISLQEINNYSAVVLSPDVGLPKIAGIMPHLLNSNKFSKKILGVCLGMQAIAQEFEAQLNNLNTVYHSIVSPTYIKNYIDA